MNHPDLAVKNGYNMPSDQPLIIRNDANFFEGSSKFIPQLKQMNGFYVMQKANLCEIVTKCRMANKYKIYNKDTARDARMGYALFQVKEFSDCLPRFCLPNGCRPFRVQIQNAKSNSDSEKPDVYLELVKNCQWNCWCFNRPEISINYVENDQTLNLGKIVYPCALPCCLDLNVMDAQGTQRFKIHGECLQVGLWCKYPCQFFQTIVFDIFEGSSTTPLGSLARHQDDYLKACCTDLDSYCLNFSTSMSWTDRALLLSAAVFLDFMRFEF